MKKLWFIPICWAALLAAQQSLTLDTSAPAKVTTLQAITHHVQGIDTDGSRLWVTSVETTAKKGHLFAFSVSDGALLSTVDLLDGERFHPGGISADADSIWVPVAEYKAHSTAVIQRRSKATLQVISEFSVPDHIGCVAVTPDYIIGGNWDSRDFYVWDHKGKLLRKVASETGNAYQDLKYVAGKLVGSGTLTGRQGAVDWMDLTDFHLTSRMLIGNTDKAQPFTREGMTIFRNEIWFLPEDNTSRLFAFRLPRL